MTENNILLEIISFITDLESCLSLAIFLTPRIFEGQACVIFLDRFQVANLDWVGAVLINKHQVDVFQAFHLHSLLVKHAVGLIDVRRKGDEVA